MTDTPLDLDAIEARAKAATDGPWSWEVSDDRRWVDVTAPDYERVIATTHDDDLADFIAHARTDVPALVAALRKAEAERDEQARFKEAQRADKRKALALLSEWRMRAMRAEAKVAAVLALHAPHGRLDDLHCAQHDPGSYPCATARAAGAS